MKIRDGVLGAVFLMALPLDAAAVTNVAITSFANGILQWTNVNPQLYYQVEWKPALDASNVWTSAFRGCQDVQSGGALISAAVPMFFRIRGTEQPVHVKTLSPTNLWIEGGYYDETFLDLVDGDLAPGNIKKDVDVFGILGLYEGGGGWPAPVPKTGQTVSYRTGDDGDLQPGVAWPNPRFTIDAARWTVTDNLTGLMWRRIADLCGQVTWDEAIDRSNTLDEFGYSDWRLPTLKEMQSLVDTRYLSPALGNTAGTGQWTNPNPFYSVQPTAAYWTSTTGAGDTAMKWHVNLYYGLPGRGSKSITYCYVWPVRDAD